MTQWLRPLPEEFGFPNRKPVIGSENVCGNDYYCILHAGNPSWNNIKTIPEPE
jgi:hypothetical protein